MVYTHLFNSLSRSHVLVLLGLAHKTYLFGLGIPLFASPPPAAAYVIKRKLQWIFQQEVTASLEMVICGFLIKVWLSLLWVERQEGMGRLGIIWGPPSWSHNLPPSPSHFKIQHCGEVETKQNKKPKPYHSFSFITRKKKRIGGNFSDLLETFYKILNIFLCVYKHGF